MNIYISHSTAFDYRHELYEPIRRGFGGSEFNIVLPHENSDDQFDVKEFYKNCDLVIAEVSYPSTGQGIELGWAENLGIKITCIYKSGMKFSGALKVVCKDFVEYSNTDDMVEKINKILKETNETIH